MDEASDKTPAMLEIEQRRGETIETSLSRLYYGEGKTFAEVGAAIGVSESTVWKWMQRFGIAPVKMPANAAGMGEGEAS